MILVCILLVCSSAPFPDCITFRRVLLAQARWSLEKRRERSSHIWVMQSHRSCTLLNRGILHMHNPFPSLSFFNCSLARMHKLPNTMRSGNWEYPKGCMTFIERICFSDVLLCRMVGKSKFGDLVCPFHLNTHAHHTRVFGGGGGGGSTLNLALLCYCHHHHIG